MMRVSFGSESFGRLQRTPDREPVDLVPLQLFTIVNCLVNKITKEQI